MRRETMNARIMRLCPGNVPRYVLFYDNGETWDRYTSLFTGRYADGSKRHVDGWFYRGMSSDPFHPQGFGICDSSRTRWDLNPAGYPPAVGRRVRGLGLRIRFADLPEPCRRSVVLDYANLWNLDTVATLKWCGLPPRL